MTIEIEIELFFLIILLAIPNWSVYTSRIVVAQTVPHKQSNPAGEEPRAGLGMQCFMLLAHHAWPLRKIHLKIFFESNRSVDATIAGRNTVR